MSAFGSISLANKFGIILGCLVFFAFGAGLVKLWWNKRRLRANIKLADVEAARNSQRPLDDTRRDDDPRYLFGVRAIERGYFGGVAQTRSISSLGSLVESNASISSPSNRAVETHTTVPHSVLSQSHGEKEIRRKPAPLRLQPIDLSLNEKNTPSPVSPDKDFVVSPASPISQPNLGNMPSQRIQEPNSNPKPLLTHSLPPVPSKDSKRPMSFLPRFNFSEPLRENLGSNLFIPTPANSIKSKRPRGSTTTQVSLPKVIEQPNATAKSSPLYSAFPAVAIPPDSRLRSQRSIFPQADRERVHSRKPSNFSMPVPPIPSSHNRGNSSGRDSSIRDITSDNSDAAIQYARKRKTSDAISLAILTGTPTNTTFPHLPPSPPDSESEESSSRGRAVSVFAKSHARKSSSLSLSRTRDSIRRSSRSRSVSKRRSVQRDVLHYDPSSHHRNRSGSIQGRPVDFSQPRESPFSDLAAIATKGHTVSGSTGSENSLTSYYTITRAEPSSKTSYNMGARMEGSIAEVDSPNNFDNNNNGSRLRYTLDNFGTKNLAAPITNSNDDKKTPRTSVIEGKLAEQLMEKEGKVQKTASLSVMKVGRRRPQRISIHGAEWGLPKSGMARLDTHITSTSPVVGSYGVGDERFPKLVG